MSIGRVNRDSIVGECEAADATSIGLEVLLYRLSRQASGVSCRFAESVPFELGTFVPRRLFRRNLPIRDMTFDLLRSVDLEA